MIYPYPRGFLVTKEKNLTLARIKPMVGGTKMDDEKILTVDELDELLAKEFAKDDSEEEVVDEEEVEEPVAEDETDEQESDESEEEVEETGEPEPDIQPEVEKPKPKRSPEEKKDYAFAELRKKATEAKRLADEQAKKIEEQEELLKSLMEASDFTDIDEFKKALNKQVDEKRRAKSGYTEAEYAKIKSIESQEAELKRREEAIRQQEFNARAKSFDTTVRELIHSHGLGEKDREQVYNELEKAGYTADVLLALPNPRHLINGVIGEIKGDSTPVKRKTVDTRPIPTPPSKESLQAKQDKLLASELRDYERRKFGQ